MNKVDINLDGVFNIDREMEETTEIEKVEVISDSENRNVCLLYTSDAADE